jgi:hypothetical protein
MKKYDLAELRVAELVAVFEDIALHQDEILANYEPIKKYNALADQMEAVIAELKSREGDQRSALLPLLNSKNFHVKLKSAATLLPVHHDIARATLEYLKASGVPPEATSALTYLENWDNGLR